MFQAAVNVFLCKVFQTMVEIVQTNLSSAAQHFRHHWSKSSAMEVIDASVQLWPRTICAWQHLLNHVFSQILEADLASSPA